MTNFIKNLFNEWHIEPIYDMKDMEDRILTLGFLPMFSCGIEGYSVCEATPDFWRHEDGPWDWKGPVLRSGDFAYGKFFNKKAVWISREWLPDFINFRKSKNFGINEDAMTLDDLVLQTIYINETITAKEISDLLGLSNKPQKRRAWDLVDDTKYQQYESESNYTKKISIEPSLTRLMMKGCVVISDFIHKIDKKGNEYGWGIAKYSTPEYLFGNLHTNLTPQESFDRIFKHLKKTVPIANKRQLLKLLS